MSSWEVRKCVIIIKQSHYSDLFLGRLSIHDCSVSRLLIWRVSPCVWMWVDRKFFFFFCYLGLEQAPVLFFFYTRNVSTSVVIINSQKLIISSVGRLQVLCGPFWSSNIVFLLLSVRLKDRIRIQSFSFLLFLLDLTTVSAPASFSSSLRLWW